MVPFRTAIIIPHYARSPGLANCLHAVDCLGSTGVGELRASSTTSIAIMDWSPMLRCRPASMTT